MHLTDHQWALIQPVLPPPASTARGRPPYPDRLLLDAILWKVRTGLPWYSLPIRYSPEWRGQSTERRSSLCETAVEVPAWQTCYYHFRLQRDAGILEQIYALLAQDLFPRLDFDPEVALQLGLMSFHRQGRSYRFRLDLQEDGTWQTATLRSR